MGTSFPVAAAVGPRVPGSPASGAPAGGSVCLLIAANNEAPTLPRVLAGALPHVAGAVVVDDGSTDGTAGAARAAGVEVLRHDRRRGKGAALRTGLDFVLSRPYRHVLFMDGDGQHDPQDVPLLLAPLRRDPPPDFVLGSRLRPATRREFPRQRYLTNLFGRYVLSRLTGQEIEDSQSGFRLIGAERLRQVELESEGFEIETEILLKLCARRIALVNVPVSIRYQAGRSHYRTVADTYRVCMATLRHG